MDGAGRRGGVNDFYAGANLPGPMSLVGRVPPAATVSTSVGAYRTRCGQPRVAAVGMQKCGCATAVKGGRPVAPSSID
jgi:hypothetical protein